MISEKRFTFKCKDNICSIFDNGLWLKIEEIVDELNSLSNTVLAYDKTVAELRKDNEQLKEANEQLKKENEKLRFLVDINSVSERTKLERQVDEQQATINRQSEQHKARLNKLINENGELRMRIVEQQATIEQLQKKLSECQGHKLELTPIPISRAITLKEAEDSIRITKYEELFDDE